MSPSIRLGRLFGIEIAVNWSLIFVFAYIAWALATQVLPAAAPRNGAVAYQTFSQTLGGLLIASNAWLAATNTGGFSLTVSGNAIIEPGGGIIADAIASGGTGAGHSSSTSGSPCGGGGYGGVGASSTNGLAVGGTAYGSVTFPNNNGSSGFASKPAETRARFSSSSCLFSLER